MEVSTKKCEKLLEIHDFWVILVVETSLATVLAMSRSLFWTLWIVWILTNFYWFLKKIKMPQKFAKKIHFLVPQSNFIGE